LLSRVNQENSLALKCPVSIPKLGEFKKSVID
jgi:hypothetical protein